MVSHLDNHVASLLENLVVETSLEIDTMEQLHYVHHQHHQVMTLLRLGASCLVGALVGGTFFNRVKIWQWRRRMSGLLITDSISRDNNKKLHSRPCIGKIAVVTGASRGVGRGIALGLAEAGFTVVATGRTLEDSEHRLPNTGLRSLVEEAARFGGIIVPVRCDSGDDAQVRSMIADVVKDHGCINLLVNNAFQIPARFEENFTSRCPPFWEAKEELWDPVMRVGLRNHYIAACEAVALDLAARDDGTPQREGGLLIVNISSVGGRDSLMYTGYGVGKVGVDRMARDMDWELKKNRVKGIQTLSLWPGVINTERIKERASFFRRKSGLSIAQLSETAVFSGRAIAMLFQDSRARQQLTGKTVTTVDLAGRFGVTDLDGSQPPAQFSISWWIQKTLLRMKNAVLGIPEEEQ